MTIHRTTMRRGLNVISGLYLDDVALTATAAEVNKLAGNAVAAADLTKLAALTITAAEANRLDDSAIETGGLGVFKVAKFRFDPTLTAGMKTQAAHGLGTTIPISAIVCGGVVDVNTAFTSANGTATVAIMVQGANDIITAAAVSGAPFSSVGVKAITPKINTPDSTSIKLTAAREITATVGVEALTGGKLTGFLVYFDSAVSA